MNPWEKNDLPSGEKGDNRSDTTIAIGTASIANQSHPATIKRH